MNVRERPYSELRALTDGDPLARATAWPSDGRLWQTDRAVALIGLDSEIREPSLVALGAQDEIPELLDAVADGLPDGTYVTVPRGTVHRLPVRDLEDWNFRSTDTPLSAQQGEQRVQWLAEDEAGDVAALLKEANPGSFVWPGDRKVRRWAGIRDADGQLVACLADTTRLSDVGHISGIGVHPGTRGGGLGRAITASATRELLDSGHELVTLGLHADNDIGRGLYDRLGFTDHHQLTSGQLDRQAAAR